MSSAGGREVAEAAVDRRPTGAPEVLAVRGEGVSVWRGRRRVLADATFAVRAGELVVVGGRNGSGKSTLLQAIAGLIEPTSGAIHTFGGPASSRASFADSVYLPDDAFVYPNLTAREHLVFSANLFGVGSHVAYGEAVLDRLGGGAHLDDDVAHLSHGSARKVGVAMALLRRAGLLLLDEPFNGLDAEACATLWDLLDEERAAGRSVVVATHIAPPADLVTRCTFWTVEDGQVLRGPGRPTPGGG